MTEQRKYRRVPLDSILFFRVETPAESDNPAPLIRTQTPLSVDLSEGGMKFLAVQELPLGLLLRILIVFQGTKYPVELEGNVVWTEKSPDSLNWYAGVEFVNLSETKTALLKKYVTHAPPAGA